MTYLLLTFAILNALDGWTTWQILRFGGQELSPWLAWLMLKIGRYNALLLAKIAPVAVVWYLQPEPKYLAWIVAGYAAIVASNLYQLRKPKHG